MADVDNKNNSKQSRRSIPRYIGSKKDNSGLKENTKPKDTVDGAGGVRHESRKDRKHKTGLNLQGPFRPSIVGIRKHDEKRKRNESAESRAIPCANTVDNPSPKRNQKHDSVAGKSKCAIDFNHAAADTKFSGAKVETVQPKFHARGSKPIVG